ncbi:uncharacterized protein TNCV_431711 [Trichonephila clavipes]|nr:uncharacterized protein TNCV_431711 [Trichonephila clavipes]
MEMGFDWKWLLEEKPVSIPDSGLPRGTTEREDHRIQHTAVAQSTPSAAEIRAAVGTPMTQQTVKKWLLRGQLQARRLVANIPLTPSHCRLRGQ